MSDVPYRIVVRRGGDAPDFRSSHTDMGTAARTALALAQGLSREPGGGPNIEVAIFQDDRLLLSLYVRPGEDLRGPLTPG